MNIYNCMKIFILFNLLVFSLNQSKAGDDLIYKDGFDLTEAQINCPAAEPLVAMTNDFGHIYYSANGIITSPGIKKYYSVSLADDSWFYFNLTPGEYFNLRPTMTMYDEFGNGQIAQNASNARAASFSYHNKSSQIYCLKVEDYSTYANLDPQGGDNFDFILSVTPVTFADYDAFNQDIEPNDSILEPQGWISLDEDLSTHFLGLFNAEGDVDVYEFITPSIAEYISLKTKNVGSLGNGSSTDFTNLEVIDAISGAVLTSIDPESGARRNYLPVNPNTKYYFRVSNPVSAQTANPFYVFTLETGLSSRQSELDNTANNSWLDAEIAINNPLNISPAPPFNFYYISGYFSGNQDQDWWQFEVDSYPVIITSCYSSYEGSGVLNAKVEIFDLPTNEPLQMEIENGQTGIKWTANNDATMPPINVINEQTHYLKISADQFSGTVTGRFYRCFIFVGDLDPPT